MSISELVVILTIAGFGLLATIALMVWGLCAAARHGDEQLERPYPSKRPPRFPCEGLSEAEVASNLHPHTGLLSVAGTNHRRPL